MDAASHFNGGVDEVSLNLIEHMHVPLIAPCIIIDFKTMIIRSPLKEYKTPNEVYVVLSSEK